MTMLDGFKYLPECINRDDQKSLVTMIRNSIKNNPLYTPTMPGNGRPFSVRMTNLGTYGWVSDASGYRYEKTHPVTEKNWPDIPKALLDLWKTLTDYPLEPQACLVNFYDSDAKMGLHVDNDEEDFAAPVVSISLGDTARFRIGGLTRNSPTKSFKVSSGDVIILGGAARLAFHGIDKIYPGTSTLLSKGGRLNLTLRRVTQP